MKARYLLSFVILCSLLLSCKDDRPFEEAYLWQNNASLTASLTTLLFEADASTQTVAINTNSGYGITVDQTWLTVERAADNQTLTVSVQANTTSTTRNATITINASGKSQTISVSQSAASLNVSKSILTFDASESSESVSVTASGDFIYSTDASWLTITKDSATTRTESVTYFTITAAANTEESKRTATITLTLGSITKTIEVMQEAGNTRTFTITGNGKTVTFKMKKVQGGTFQMGSTTGNSDEQPVHSVTLTKDYFICETEVTQALWYAVMGQSPTSGGVSWISSFGIGDNYPAYYISYEDCQSFLTALNSKLSSQLGSGEQFRFPTEAEWEFAAKGGNKSKGYTYAGSNTIDDVAWYNNNSSGITNLVKTKAANELGLYDMTGNVCEWCEDWYGSYSTGAQTDPTGAASGSDRVYRGGGWGSNASFCRVAYRSGGSPSTHYVATGLRLCLGAPVSAPEPSLSVSPTSLSFGASASSKTVNVTANGDYTFSTSASWLTITQSSDKTTLTVSAEANTGTTDRTATITLTLGSLTQTISVSQEALSLSVSPTSLSFDAAASSKSLTVTANGEYTYSTDASWLTITPSSDNSTLTVEAEANTDASERTATITFSLGSLTQTISVTQEAAQNISDDERTFTVTGHGKTVTFKMKKVEGGTFQMGSTSGEDNEQPVHSVTITKDYYMGETEVTNGLWYAVMGSAPSTSSAAEHNPVESISYSNLEGFISALNYILSSQLSSGEQFRFPTEAEWEFAARGGNKSNGYIYSGSNTLDDVAWYEDNSGNTTHPVKAKLANELGLYDMTGNVWEWCSDWYGSYTSSAQTDPTGATSGSYRVFRGGCWNNGCRVTFRFWNKPTLRMANVGLRLCLGTPIE